MDDMSSKNMNAEELLSAYLDGEVTDAERAQVEQLLAADPEMRAALDELRALSAALQSLPKLTVGEDLSQRVLRRAERAMLERQTSEPLDATASVAQLTVAANKADDSRPQPTLLERGSYGAGWTRRLAWPLAAIAAALLVMIVNQKQQHELALAPVHAPNQAPLRAPRAEVAHDAEMYHAANGEVAETPAQEASESAAGRGAATEDEAVVSGVGQPDEAAPGFAAQENFGAPRMSAMREAEGQADSDTSTDARAKLPSKAAEKNLAERRSTSEPATRKRNAADDGVVAKGSAHAMSKSGVRGQGYAGNAPPSSPGPSALPPGEQAASGFAVPGAVDPAAVPVAAVARAAASDAVAQLRKQIVAEPRSVELVVEVLAAAEGNQPTDFNALLGRQNIQFDKFDELDHIHRLEQLKKNSLAAKDRAATELQTSDIPTAVAEEAAPGLPITSGDKALANNSAAAKKKAALEAANKPETALANRADRQGGDAGKLEAESLSVQSHEGEFKSPETKRDAKLTKQAERQSGENLGGGKAFALPSSEVDVIFVTATPAQVRGLLQDLDSASHSYRTLAMDGTPPADHAAQHDPATNSQPLAAAAPAEAETKAGAKPAEQAAEQIAGEFQSEPSLSAPGYAVRMRVAEAELAALLDKSSFDQLMMPSARGASDSPTQQSKLAEAAKGPAGAALQAGKSAEDGNGAKPTPTVESLAPGKSEAEVTGGQPKRSQGPRANATDKTTSPTQEKQQQSPGRSTSKETPSAGSDEAADATTPIEDALAADQTSQRRLRAPWEKQLRDVKADAQIRIVIVVRGAQPDATSGQPGAVPAPAAEPAAPAAETP